MMSHARRRFQTIAADPDSIVPLDLEPLAMPCCGGTATVIGGGGLPLHMVLERGLDYRQIALGFLAEASRAPNIRKPVGHIVCSNKIEEAPDHSWQMLQAMRALRAVGVDHRKHGWLAVSHGTHIHVLFSRVRQDGAALFSPGAQVALCLERACLDAEAGFGDRLVAVSSKDGLVAQAWKLAQNGNLAFELRQGAARVTVQVQGTAYDNDIRTIGWTTPTATAGTWTIKECVKGNLDDVVDMLKHVLAKSQGHDRC